MGVVQSAKNPYELHGKRPGVSRCATLLVVLALLLNACGGGGTGPGSEDLTPPLTSGPSTPLPTPDPTETSDQALDFHSGRDVTLLVPSAPGGAVDATARFWAEWLPQYFDGGDAPTIVVENMPGGGHVIASNHYELQVDRDGLTVMILATPGHMAWSFDLASVQFDLAGWEPLMSIGGGNVWVANPQESGISRVDDLVSGNHNPLLTGGSSVGSGEVFEVFAFVLLDVDMDITWGYDGRGPVLIAVEQGELNMAIVSAPAYAGIEPLVDAGELVAVFTMGQILPDGEVVRDPNWPELPHIGEVYEMMHGQPPSGPVWEAVLLGGILARTLGRTLWVHADAPEEALASLRNAVERATADPAFVQAALDVLGDTPVGAETRDLVDNLLLDIDPSTIDLIVDYVIEQYDHDLRAG